MGFFLPMAIGAGASLLGSVIRGAMSGGDPYQQNKQMAHATAAAHPDSGGYGASGEASANRINAITNPWLLSALADQRGVRDLQTRYMDDLLQTALGNRSQAMDSYWKSLPQQQADIGSLANSARGNWNASAARGQSMQLQAAAPITGLSGAQEAADIERNQAQDMLIRVAQGRGQQDLQAQGAEVTKRNTEDKQRLAGEDSKLRWRAMGAQEYGSRLGNEVDWEAIRALAARNS